MNHKVLIVITSKNCSHCHKFNNVKKSLEKAFGKNFITYEFNNINNAPSFVKKYTNWVPNLILLDENLWKNALKGKKVKFSDIKILNSKVENNKLKYNKEYDIFNPQTYKNLSKI